MARITVEDCLEQVENRFHLVRVASKRARQIMNGKEPTLNWDNDKATVLALREIAAGNITEEMLDEKPVVNDDEAVFDQSEIDEEIGNLLSEGEGNSEGDNPLNASSEEESLAPDSLEENSTDADREEPEEESI
tara:strand:- start:273 stop:674 length:402 start_codon:yes stop_codon:yes gene_type:complete